MLKALKWMIRKNYMLVHRIMKQSINIQKQSSIFHPKN